MDFLFYYTSKFVNFWSVEKGIKVMNLDIISLEGCVFCAGVRFFLCVCI